MDSRNRSKASFEDLKGPGPLAPLHVPAISFSYFGALNEIKGAGLFDRV
jgi:hypothetical protein